MADRCNEKHITPLERLNQQKLKLNALNATGALTQAAYNAELKAANTLYTQQSTLMGRMGLSGAGLKSAAGAFLNPWLLAAGALALGAKEAATFEKAMDRVLALTGASADDCGVSSARESRTNSDEDVVPCSTLAYVAIKARPRSRHGAYSHAWE
jgi:hypothetical protein